MKKVLIIMLCIFTMFELTGCGKKKKTTVDNNNQEINDNTIQDNQTNNEQNNNDVKKTTYYCNLKEDGNGEFYFYYLNDELNKIEYIFSLVNDEDYDTAKEEADNYEGITVTKRADGYGIIEIDITKGGLLYLSEKFSMFEELEDVKWNNINSIMSEKYNCSNKGSLDPITGTGSIK